ncbi:MAG: hypothetical protein AAF628_23195 [Planctomycetota bacterium]
MRCPTLAVLASLSLVACAELEPDASSRAHPMGVLARWQHRAGPDGRIRDGAFRDADRQRRAVLDAAPVSAEGLRNWNWQGPGNIGGRVRAVVIHPTNPSTMWLATAGGGVWKTTDAGGRWEPKSDFLTVLPVGCIVLDPANPDRLFVGTGEGGFDSASGSSNLAVPRGDGIFVSDDGGDTWNHMASTSGPDWYFVNRLAFDPNDRMVMLAATGSGIWRSANQGATWSRTSALETMDVDFHPTDSSRAIAGTLTGASLYSTDGGRSWTEASGIPPTTSIRAEVAYARSSPQTVYASVSRSAGSIWVYRSIDGGASFTRETTSTALTTYARYNNALWVDPFDPATVVIGAVNVFRSTNAGRTFSSISSGIHPDHHWLVEHPDYDGVGNRVVFCGNDGGVHRANDIRGSVSWQELNNNLGVTQFYGAAINPTTGVIVGGTQDNGTKTYNGGTETWTSMAGADGGYAAADPTDPNYFYGETQRLGLLRSTNGGRTSSSIRSGIGESRPNFIAPFILDPNDPRRMYAGGAQLWRSNNVKATTPSWSPMKATSTPTARIRGVEGKAPSHFAIDPPQNISAIAVADGDPDLIWVGHNVGQLYKTVDGLAASPIWTRMDSGSPLPDRYISRVAIDPNDHQNVWVSLQGYDPDGVWRTRDGGATWASASGSGVGSLPDVPVTSIAIHPTLPGWVYVGTDVGVFWTNDDGVNWATSTAGPGPAPVDELVWKNNRELMVVTHGRGIYLADALEPAVATSVGTGCGSGPPRLIGTPPSLGSNLALEMGGAAPSSTVLMLFGSGPAAPFALGSCTLYVTPPFPVVPSAVPTGAAGGWLDLLPIPADPSAAGQILTVQVIVASGSGPLLGVGELSNAVELTLGL